MRSSKRSRASRQQYVYGYELQPDGSLTPLRIKPSIKSFEVGWQSRNYTSRVSSDKHGAAYAYASNVWVHRCVQVRAMHVGGMAWRIVNSLTEEEIPDHPFAMALRTRPDTIYRIEWSLAIWGEAFLEIQRTPDGIAFEWLNPLGMHVDTSPGYIRNFQYSVVTSGGSAYHTLNPEQVVFLKLPNPFDDLRGLPPISVIVDEIRVDQSLSKFLASYYENDARPGILLIPESPLNKADAERFMEFWKSHLQGVRNAGRPVLSPFNLKVVEVQRPPSDSDSDVRLSMFREICAAFGVPMSYAGGWDSPTYQSAPEQRIAFYADTVIPECDLIAAQLSAYAQSIWNDPHLELRFVYDEISALAESQRIRDETYASRWQAGAITLNEYRQAIGREPLDGGDVLQLGGRLVPLSQLNRLPEWQSFSMPFDYVQSSSNDRASHRHHIESPTPLLRHQSAVQSTRSDSPVNVQAALCAIDEWQNLASNAPDISFNARDIPRSIAMDIRERLSSIAEFDGSLRSYAIKQIFDDARRALLDAQQSNSVTPEEFLSYWQNYELLQAEIGDVWLEEYSNRALEEILKRVQAGEIISEKLLNDVLAGISDDTVNRWVGDANNPGVFTRLVLAGAAAGQQALGGGDASPFKATLNIDWNLLSDLALHYARIAAGNAIRNINATTLRWFRNELTNSLMQGESQEQLVDRLKRIFLSEVRARRIAQTESTMAYSLGSRARYRVAGISYVRFQTVNDGIVCPVCSPLHNTIAPIDKGWVGVRGNPFPPIHVGCRCFLRPVPDDEIERWTAWH